MKKQYIKVPIPEAISEEGGASILFVNKQTVPLDGAVKEALAGNYCTGQATLIRNFFFGLMQSMADGVRRDGRARQIANFLTVYPVFKGEIDMDRGYDPEVNGVMIRARLLNEMDIDITDWSFEDVTEGKRSFKLTSCTTGEVAGEYRVGELGHLNGKDLPSTAACEELRVHWEVEGTDKSGDVPAAKLSSEIDRIDIAADALAELASDEYDGKTIVFTVRGNFASAKISTKLKYVAPQPEPIAKSEDGITKVMTLVDAETGADRVISGMNDFVLDGEGLELAEDGGDGVTGVKFSGPGLEDYLDLTEGARNDGSKLITGVGSYVDTLEPGDHECHLGLYLKHGEATDLNVWIDFTLRKE